MPYTPRMQYLQMTDVARDELLATLADMTSYLPATFAALTAEEQRTQGPAGAWSPVEQVWHLADLEREGFGERLRRMLHEDAPQLPDFDGTQVALDRRYRERALADGIAAFVAARRANLELLRTLDGAAWSRTGEQAGIGQVSVCDLPAFMAQHDESHRAEIAAWFAQR
jgi:hypothetical protein